MTEDDTTFRIVTPGVVVDEEDHLRRLFAKFLAEQPQRLMPTVVNGCPRGCLTNTVCLHPECALQIKEG